MRAKNCGYQKQNGVGDNPLADREPNPPPHLLKQISGDPLQESFIRSFPHVRSEVKRYLTLAEFDFSNFTEILDLGCGVGRFLFAFQPEILPKQRLWGCDISEECVRWCQDNIDFANVKQNSITPPLPFNADQFNFVYALSVFTHLRIDLQFLWTWEVYRILHPGGVLFLSLHGPYFFPVFFDVCRSEPKCSVAIYSLGDDGLFAYLDRSNQEQDQGQIEIAAAHTSGFVKELFSAFQFVKRFPQSMMAGGQDVYILQKPFLATEIAQPIIQESSVQCIFEEKITERGHKGLTLHFNLKGQRIFRVYPQIEPPGFCRIKCGIDICSKEGGAVLVHQQLPFNNNRVFGKTHYGVIKVQIPEYFGEVIVRLKTIVPDKNALSTNKHGHTAWSFPHFYSDYYDRTK